METRGKLKCLMFSLTLYSAHLRLMRKHDTDIKRLVKYFGISAQIQIEYAPKLECLKVHERVPLKKNKDSLN